MLERKRASVVGNSARGAQRLNPDYRSMRAWRCCGGVVVLQGSPCVELEDGDRDVQARMVRAGATPSRPTWVDAVQSVHGARRRLRPSL
jgi:hypothetical protein